MRQGCLDGYAMLGLRPVVHWFHYGLALLSVWCVLFIMCCSFFIIGHPYLILLFPFFIMWHTFLIKCYALFIMQYRPVMRTLAYLVWILCRVHFLSWVEFSLCDFLLSCKNFSCEGFHYVLWALYFFILMLIVVFIFHFVWTFYILVNLVTRTFYSPRWYQKNSSQTAEHNW